ncbi:MAG: DUF3800 domain-containing protein [Gammaproteobacteria bacterium]|nr:DUF3800 domain-containing protein [Gammaproteobacteria bacterium]
MFIYLDESGDLGFDYKNKKPSQKFVITLLVCYNKDAVISFKTSVRKTLRNKVNHKKKNKRVVDELHATSDSIKTKQYFYRHIKNQDWAIYTVVLNKRNVYDYLTNKAGRKKLYNYLANFILEKVDLSSVNPAVTMIVDKCKNKVEIEDFNKYLANQLEGRLPLNIPLYIHHEDSKASSGLQAVDSFCWGIYRKYEHSDTEWYQFYAGKIAFETEYLGK